MRIVYRACRNQVSLVCLVEAEQIRFMLEIKAMGANKLIGVEMSDERIELAKQLGLVDEVIAPSKKAL